MTSIMILSNESIFQQFTRDLETNAIGVGIKILIALVIFIICSQLIKWVRKIIKKALVAKEADSAKIKVIDSIIKIILYAILITILFGYLGIEVSSIFALLTSIGLTAGLAFQGALSNFAGGVLIIVARPFKIGDYICVPSQNLEGTVTDMGIIYTKILTLDQRLVVLPNGSLGNQNVINCSVMKNRRLELNIGIPYATDINKARSIVIDTLSKEECIVNKDIELFVTDLKESSINILIRCWIPSKDYLVDKWHLTEVIKNEFDKNGIDFPFPQIDVHMM